MTTDIAPRHCGEWMQPTADSSSHQAQWECRTCGHKLARDGICDFCSDPHPVINEAARDFQVNPGPIGVSVGDWGACQECHEMIEREDWLGLEERAIKAMRAKYPNESKKSVQLAVQSLQRQFRIHRRGPG